MHRGGGKVDKNKMCEFGGNHLAVDCTCDPHEGAGWSPTFTRIPIIKPDWVEAAIPAVVSSLSIWDRVPVTLRGWWITVACLRLLRGVYGDDRATVKALAEYVEQREQREKEIALELGLNEGEE